MTFLPIYCGFYEMVLKHIARNLCSLPLKNHWERKIHEGMKYRGNAGFYFGKNLQGYGVGGCKNQGLLSACQLGSERTERKQSEEVEEFSF